MVPEADVIPTQEQRLQEVLAAYLRDLEAGRDPDRDEILARHPDLAAELQDFFVAHQQLGRLAEPLRQAIQPIPDLHQTTDSNSETAGTMIAGRYKLLEQIGHGGMGQVWMADQRIPVKRLVALKLIKAGMDSRAVLTRFEAERQALALMDHANIARVFDGGTTDAGRPYFVMELVKGLPLTTYCDERRLSVPQRLELFVQVCSAVQHAHQKGIMHRDLKPSNILVTEYDGRPVPKVIDFGLAKALTTTSVLTEHTLHTAFGTMVGTPLYMAPEQVGINALDVDTRTDIYALGVLLYELLTGTTPLERQRMKEAAWDEVRRLIREEEPPRPSLRLSSSDALPNLATNRGTEPAKLSQLVRGDLDWIVLKALEKDRNRRYETANGLAMDIQRHLADEPVLACPPSAVYRIRKFVRRNLAALMTAGLVAAVLLIGTAVSVWQAVEANAARRLAAERLENEKQARHNAEAHFQKALNAVKQMLVVVSDQRMWLIPQMKETRQRLLDYALAFYTDLIALNPRHSKVYLERGILYENMGKLEQARDDYKHALECDPENAEAMVNIVSIPGHREGIKDEIRLAYHLRALELQPRNPVFYIRLAEHYERRPVRRKEAAAAWRKAAELVPGSAEAYYYLGRAAWDADTFRAAQENFEKCLSLAPPKLDLPYSDILIPSSHLYLARIYRALSEYDRAMAAITKGLESSWMAGFLLSELSVEGGNLLISQKKYAAALIYFDRMEQLAYGQTSYTYKSRGLVHFYLKHYEQALADIAKAVELRPEDVSNLTLIPLEDLASCPDEKFRTGLRALVDKTFEILKSKLDSDGGQDHAKIHNNLAWLLATWPDLQSRDPGMAVAHAKKAVELAPSTRAHWNTLGVAQYRNGDWKAAIEALMKSIQLREGGDSFDFFFLAMAHWQLNEKEKAREWYDRAVAWMDKNRPQDGELKRFRAEATALLGLAKATEKQKPDTK